MAGGRGVDRVQRIGHPVGYPPVAVVADRIVAHIVAVGERRVVGFVGPVRFGTEHGLLGPCLVVSGRRGIFALGQCDLEYFTVGESNAHEGGAVLGGRISLQVDEHHGHHIALTFGHPTVLLEREPFGAFGHGRCERKALAGEQQLIAGGFAIHHPVSECGRSHGCTGVAAVAAGNGTESRPKDDRYV